MAAITSALLIENDDDDISSSSEAAETTRLEKVRYAVDFKSLPAERSKTGSWKSASFIIGVEVAERFAYFGISFNLITYLTGPLGQSTATAATNVNAWTGVASLCPLLGAFLADSYLGRYRMILVATLLYISGIGLLSLSAALHSSDCESNNSACSPLQLETVTFFFSLYLVAFAQGGHKPCLQAFGADQFDEEDPKESKAKSSFFNWWYFSMSAGITIGIIVLSYIQENLSWALGFGIPCIAMCVGLLVFLLGSVTYRFHIKSNERNPFVRIGRVFVKAAANWNVTSIVTYHDEETQLLLPHNNAKFKFLDKALITRDSSEEENVCKNADLDDAKVILRLFPIWFTCLVYPVVLSQHSTFFTKQGMTMDRYINSTIQIPAASLQAFIGVSTIIFIPIYDRVLVPITRAITKKPAGISMLQRIGIGLFLSCSSMVIAALVEMKRLSTITEYGLVDRPEVTVPMSLLWLVPQYLVCGVAGVFTVVGLQEFFYDQVPKELKSAGVAMYLSTIGIGSFISSFLISIIEKATSGNGSDGWFSNNLNRAHLDYFYWLLVGVNAVAIIVYVYFARAYVYNRKGNF